MMNIPFSVRMCERSVMNVTGQVARLRAVAVAQTGSRPCRGLAIRAAGECPSAIQQSAALRYGRGAMRRGFRLVVLAATAWSAAAQNTDGLATTNAAALTSAPPAATESVSRPDQTPPPAASAGRNFDESAFRIVAERNIFDANRSGGQVRVSSSRRPARVESFTLVGTMAYEKGAFAFFDGSSSEYTKVLQANGVIASHKLVDVLAHAVKLEADGKVLELPVGSSMRREDEGTWHLGDGVAGHAESSYASTRTSAPESSAGNSNSSADQSEILKRLMERRERESQ